MGLFGDRKNMPFRFNSMFVRTILVLLLFMLANGAVFYSFLNRLYQEKLIEKQSASGFYSMRQYSVEISQVVDGGIAMMDDLFQQQDGRRLIISGEELNPDLAASVTRELAALVSNRDFFDSAMMYLQHSNQVLMSDRKLSDPESAGISGLLADYSSSLVFSGGKLYLRRAYPAKKPVAVLICQVNPRALYENIGLSGFSGSGISRIYTYDPEGTPLFANSMKYPDPGELVVSEELLDISEQPNCRTFRSGNGYMLVYEDTDNGMVHVQLLDDFSSLPLTESRAMMAGYITVMIIVLLIVSYYLADRVFTPFREMLSDIISRKDPEIREEIRQSSTNEVELIRNIALDDEQQQQMHREMMQAARETISANLMNELILGTGRTRAEVRSVMRDIESPFPEFGRYLVVAYYFEPYQMGTDAALREEIIWHEAEAMSADFWKDDAQVRMLPSRDQHHFIVICLEGGGSFDEKIDEYCMKLRASYTNYNMKFACGVSRKGRSIYDLRELAEDAMGSLRRQIYYADEESAAADISDEETRTMEEARRIFDMLSSGDSSESYGDGVSATYRMLERVALENPESAGHIYAAVMDMIAEKMVQAHIPMPINASESRALIAADGLWLPQDPRIGEIAGFLDDCVEKIISANTNDRTHYVDSAIEIIHERYFDNTLSLESIASELGLSPQYLSRLFTNRKSEGFLTYLSRYRLDRAKELLKHTNYSVSDIGLKTGFNSSQSFIRVFKRYENQTPGQFRKGLDSAEEDADAEPSEAN